MTAPERVPCCILGCRRTFKQDGTFTEIMCRDDYRLVDAGIRKLRAKIKRRGKKQGWSLRLMKMDGRLWERAKRQAIERRMGL